MIKRTGEEIDKLVERYLSLSQRIKGLQQTQKRIQAELADEMQAREVREIVTVVGKVQEITRAASVSFPAVHVLNLAQVWEESEDAILKQCGSLLMNVRQERPASTYVRVTPVR